MDFLSPVELSSYQNAWISIGSFDGVHLGHQALIKGLVERARSEGSPALVITFWPHPATFFKRAPLAWALSSPEEKRGLICTLGVDDVLTLNFNQELADLSALQFMQQLKDRLGLRGLLVGPNFALGKGREGNIHKLTEIAKDLDFKLEIAQPVNNGEGMISSSQVRTDLLEGRVKSATQKLGRPYTLNGKVVHGEHRGTGLGVPTANLSHEPERLVPGNGVYVTRVCLNGKNYASVTNIGVRPTFSNPLPVPRIEPHILDISVQLYGQDLGLEFIDYLRPEIKFESSKALVAQIQKDIQKTRDLFDAEEASATKV